MSECSICLEALKSPVSIPCGHIHCDRCLTAHINSGTSAISSTCPTCRASFNIAMPNLNYVPKKYHEFILPSVRRTYISTVAQDELKQQINNLEKSVKLLKKDKAILMEKCESSMAASSIHARGEKEAREEASVLKYKLEDLHSKYAAIKFKYNRFKNQVESEKASALVPKRKSSRLLDLTLDDTLDDTIDGLIAPQESSWDDLLAGSLGGPKHIGKSKADVRLTRPLPSRTMKLRAVSDITPAMWKRPRYAATGSTMFRDSD